MKSLTGLITLALLVTPLACSKSGEPSTQSEDSRGDQQQQKVNLGLGTELDSWAQLRVGDRQGASVVTSATWLSADVLFLGFSDGAAALNAATGELIKVSVGSSALSWRHIGEQIQILHGDHLVASWAAAE